MKDSLDNIIYVGKSKNLRSRVSSYFVNSKAHSPKVIKLVQNLRDFDIKLTDTEFEALLLECRLIKEIKPRYNRLMKSPESYCYIKIEITKKYPSIEICHSNDRSEGNLYFGPYTSKNTVERAVNGIKEHYKILCTNSTFKPLGCLKYSMGQCLGMCSENILKEQYFSIIDKVVKLLQGYDRSILREMEKEMNKASEALDFEKAASCRDYIKAVKHLVGTAKIINFLEDNKNIALVEALDRNKIKLFLLSYNKVIFSKSYSLNDFKVEDIKRSIKKHFEKGHSKNIVNMSKDDIDEAHIIYNYLKYKENFCQYVIYKNQGLEEFCVEVLKTISHSNT